MKKVLFPLVAALILTGCSASELPATPEEHDQVVEYAAGLLLKYDKNYSRQLVDIALPVPTPEGEETPAEDDPAQTEGAGQDNSGSDAPAATPAPTPPPIPTASLAEVVGIAGLSFTNAGFEVTDAYTQEAFDGAVTPDAGYKLLVAKYNVTNTTESDIMLDINALNWRVRVGYNGNSSTMTRTLMTLLPNDLAYFADNIAPGETVTLVALVDAAVGSADDVSSVQLSIGTEAGDINITN